MEMDINNPSAGLENDEVCRLCGKLSKLCIYIFGEEANRRSVSQKLQSQANISVDPHDGLPQFICLVCLGSLEFISDFIRNCHQTQKNLESTSEKTQKKNSKNGDSESDKENVVPASEEAASTTSEATKKKTTFTTTTTALKTAATTLSDKRGIERAEKFKSIKAGKNFEENTDVLNVLTDVTADKNAQNENIDEVKTRDKSATGSSKNSSDELNCSIIEDNEITKSKRSKSFPLINLKDKRKYTKKIEKQKKIDLYFSSSRKKQNVDEDYTPVKSLKISQKSKPDKYSVSGSEATKENSTKIKTIISDQKSDQEGSPTEYSSKRNNQRPNEKIKNSSPTSSMSDSESRRSLTNSEGKLAKVSELITDEQKETIEINYTVDMSHVNELEVKNKIVILDRAKFQCSICELIYPRLDKCQVHIWRHLDMKPYLCKLCDFSTLTVSNIRCHIRKSHLKIKPYTCHLCNKSYISSTLLEQHINIHTGARPHHCEICKFSTNSKQALANHILTHKPEKDILCKICDKAFYSKSAMRAHQITHNKEDAFKCDLCSAYVTSQEALERHREKLHSKDYICKTCNRVYRSKKALHNHEIVHSDAKFACPLCPNIYKSSHILKEHLLKHEGIRQYKCTKCSKSFAQQSHLAAHTAVHSDVTFDCPGCGKGFNRHDNMKVHAKRCRQFLSKPELKKMLSAKRKISFSKNDTARKSDVRNSTIS